MVNGFDEQKQRDKEFTDLMPIGIDFANGHAAEERRHLLPS